MTEQKRYKRKTGTETPSPKQPRSGNRSGLGKSRDLAKPGRYTGEFSPNRMFVGIEDLIMNAAASTQEETTASPHKKAARLREQIDYPGGRTRLLRYDKQGDLKEIVYQDRKVSYLDSWIKTAADLWMHYDNSGQPTGDVFTGMVRLDEFGNLRFENVVDGTTRIERSDGATTFLPGDGSAVTSERGRVLRIAYANQNSTTLTYDEQSNKLVGMRTPDGATWKNTISTEWLVVDDSGKPIDVDSLRFDGHVSVDGNGTLRMSGLDGSVITIATSGSKSILNPDLSRVVMSASGVVESVTPRAIPGVWRFKYDEAQLQSFTHDGVKWEREHGQKWRRSDRDEPWMGEVSVQPTGAVVFREQGLKPVTSSANGSLLEKRVEGGVKVTNRDGSVVVVDTNGLVVRVAYPDGSEREFEYDDGELVMFSYTDSNKTFFDSYRLTGDAWKQNQYGKETGRSLKGTPELLQSSAEFAYQDLDNGIVVVHRPDGSRLILSDALVVQEVKNAAGLTRSFSYDNSGRLVAFSDNSGTWTSRDGSKWNNEAGKAKNGNATIQDDGTFFWKDASKEVLYCTDGFRLIRRGSTSLLLDAKGRLVELSNDVGHIYKFAYDHRSSLITTLTKPDGTTLITDDGLAWTSEDGENQWLGSVRINEHYQPVFLDSKAQNETEFGFDGSRTSTELNPSSAECGRQFVQGVDGRFCELRPAVDFEELNDAAARLVECLESSPADVETLKAVLEQLSVAERTALRSSYEKRTGMRLSAAITATLTPGATREEMLSLLARDTDGEDFAGAVRQLLASEEVEGPSDSLHQELLRLLSCMSVLDKLNANRAFALREPYGTIDDAIEDTEKFPPALKKAAGIYMKGEELLNDVDRQNLAELSIELADLEMLRRSIEKMNVQDRSAFVQRVGEGRLTEVFGDEWQFTPTAKKSSKAKTGR